MSESEAQGGPKALSFSIWPPSQRTREAVVGRLVETLSSESVLSKRYGTVPHHEAADLAKKIEEDAFLAAKDPKDPNDDDGMETLQVYSKEISKRMLDAVKSRSVPNANDDDKLPAADAHVPGEGEGEDASDEPPNEPPVPKPE